MAIDIKFDLAGNPELPTFILATRNGKKLGQLNARKIEISDKFNDVSEVSFILYKTENDFYMDDLVVENSMLTSSDDDSLKDLNDLFLTADFEQYVQYSLWDKVVDFRLVYCQEWDMWFEISVELDEENETIKTVLGKQLGQAELSQIMLYNIEINTEDDIARDDYKISILYDENDQNCILNRLLKDKAPHYHIAYVSPTIAKLQRSFSFDSTSIYDAFQEIAEEIGCLFVFHSGTDPDGKIQRAISVYDLQQNCLNVDCGHRGEFIGECPECGSTDIRYGYGEDTTIFVTADELAADGIQFVTDVDSVKNCFKLEAGDDLMTATVRNCNPNGTDYIWYRPSWQNEDMSHELVGKIEYYDQDYEYYNNEHESDLDSELVSKYNALVDKYSEYKEELEPIDTIIKGYSSLMNAYYNAVDLSLYLQSSMMPSVEMSDTNAEEQVKLLTTTSLSPVAVADISIVSLATANSVVLAMAKVIVRSTFKVEVKENSSSLYDVGNKRYWKGKFIITNYSDEEDIAESGEISVELNDDLETVTKQKIDKLLNKKDADDMSISGLFEKEYDDFCAELKKYALNPLNSFHNACQACIDILIEQGAGNKSDESKKDLYNNLYTPYYNKLKAIESEMKIREDEINIINGVYNEETNELVTAGIRTNIEKAKNQIQDALNFEKYLGTDLWLEFCSYRREDKYSNDNYISDGLNNAELFKRALEFIKVAKDEIYKSAELQHSISTNLKNLFAIPKFKVLVKYFNTGNWLRVAVDDEIYKLRLLDYDIDFDDFDNIPVTFSDVLKVRDGISDTQNVLEQAKSMATSYDSVQKQASKGDKAKTTIEEWIEDGLKTAVVQINNNNSEGAPIIDNNGITCFATDDITGEVLPKKLRITHNIMAYTDDDFQTVRMAIGEHEYTLYDESKDEFIKDMGYGQNAEFMLAGVVGGSQIIGGDIYSDNYSSKNKTGSHLDLRDGTFSFAGGRLTYDGDHLSVDGEITVTTAGTIGCWNVNNFSIYKGSEIFGNANGMYFGADGLSLGNKFKVTSSGVATMTDADIEGKVVATEGEIGGWTIGTSKLTGGNIELNSNGSLKGGSTYTWSIGTNGKAIFSNAEINGKITTNDLSATGGTIGGASLNGQGIFFNNSNTGWGLWGTTAHADIAIHAGANTGNIGSAPFRVYHNGNVVANNLSSSNADISGKVVATSGNIGAWKVYSSGMIGSATQRSDGRYYGIAFDPTSGAFSSNLNVLAIGKLGASGTSTEQAAVEGSWGDAAFRIRADGSVVTTNITATGGSIGGWAIGNGSLQGTTSDNHYRMELYANGKEIATSSTTTQTFYILMKNLTTNNYLGGITPSGWRDLV